MILSMLKQHLQYYRDYQGIGDDNWGTHSVFAQEEDFLHQLIWGVRFLDVRAGFYPTTPERFWLVHGIIKVLLNSKY